MGTENEQAQDQLHDLARDPHPTARRCSRVGCAGIAVSTMTADYEGRAMAVGPLSPEREPPALDLCARHTDALTAPDGWQLYRHDAGR